MVHESGWAQHFPSCTNAGTPHSGFSRAMRTPGHFFVQRLVKSLPADEVLTKDSGQFARAHLRMHRSNVAARTRAMRILRATSLVMFAVWFGLLWPIRIGASMSERGNRAANALGCHSAPAVIDSPAKPVPTLPRCHQATDGAEKPPGKAAVASDDEKSVRGSADHAAQCRCNSGASIGRRPCGCGHSLGAIPPPPDPVVAWSRPLASQRLVVMIADVAAAKTAAQPALPLTPPPNL